MCFHEKIEKPVQTTQTGPDGKTGTAWQLPYRVSKGKHDRDNKNDVCMTYDVVFHNDVQMFLIHSEFKKFAADTALDGVSRVIAEHNEKVSSDYKILKHITCKGEKPRMMTIKVKNAAGGRGLLDSMDISKSKTALEKEIEEQIRENRRNMGLSEELPGEFTEAELAAKKQLMDEAAARAKEEEED